jgi:hypothetical protein
MCASHGCVRREPVGSGRCLGPEVDLPVCPTRGGRRFLVPEGPPGPERPCTIVWIKMFCVKNKFRLSGSSAVALVRQRLLANEFVKLVVRSSRSGFGAFASPRARCSTASCVLLFTFEKFSNGVAGSVGASSSGIPRGPTPRAARQSPTTQIYVVHYVFLRCRAGRAAGLLMRSHQ